MHDEQVRGEWVVAVGAVRRVGRQPIIVERDRVRGPVSPVDVEDDVIASPVVDRRGEGYLARRHVQGVVDEVAHVLDLLQFAHVGRTENRGLRPIKDVAHGGVVLPWYPDQSDHVQLPRCDVQPEGHQLTLGLLQHVAARSALEDLVDVPLDVHVREDVGVGVDELDVFVPYARVIAVGVDDVVLMLPVAHGPGRVHLEGIREVVHDRVQVQHVK